MQKKNKEEFNIAALIDEATERSLLRALIEFQTDDVENAIIELKEDVFYGKEHKMIFSVIKDLDDRNFKLQMETVRTEILNKNLDCMDTLMQVALTEPTGSVPFVIEALQEWERKRQLYYSFTFGMNALQEGTDSSFVLANAMAQKSDDVVLSSTSDFTSYADLVIKYKYETAIPKIATGITFVDAKLKGGIERGQFILLFGDPEAGKSVLASQIARHFAKNFKTIYFPFEFDERSFYENMKPREKEFVHEKLFVDDRNNDIHDMAIQLKRFAKKGGELAIIDSQLMNTNTSNKGTAEERETEKFLILQQIVKRYGIRIIYISIQGKEDTRGGIITPMKSKAGAHLATQIWYIEKPKMILDDNGDEENKGQRVFKFVKNKQTGQFGSKPIQLNYRTMEFAGAHFDTDDKRSKNYGGERKPNSNKGVPRNIPKEGYVVTYDDTDDNVYIPGGLG